MEFYEFCNETTDEQSQIALSIRDLCEKAYERGYSDGVKASGNYNDGYTVGKDEGYKIGLEVGTQNGYNDGYEADKTDVYNQGYADGQKCHEETTEDIYRKGFENGLEQAWECARKLCQTEKYGGLEEHCAEIFDRQDTFDVFDYSASEAIAKMKEYEQTDEMSMEYAITTLKYQYDNGQMEQNVHKALGMAIKSMEYIDDHAL